MHALDEHMGMQQVSLSGCIATLLRCAHASMDLTQAVGGRSGGILHGKVTVKHRHPSKQPCSLHLLSHPALRCGLSSNASGAPFRMNPAHSPTRLPHEHTDGDQHFPTHTRAPEATSA